MDEQNPPRARQSGLLIEPMDEELLVFDTERNRAHSLNRTAAEVWQACDGRRGPEELASRCGIDQPTLTLALERLHAVHLLEDGEPPAGVSRRVMIRRSLAAGAAIGAAIPVIRSITAPTLAQAQSTHKGNAGQHCTTDAQCSSKSSYCNASFHSCQRGGGALCSHTTSCPHTTSYHLVCASGSCNNLCTADDQCPPGYPTCSAGGFCLAH